MVRPLTLSKNRSSAFRNLIKWKDLVFDGETEARWCDEGDLDNDSTHAIRHANHDPESHHWENVVLTQQGCRETLTEQWSVGPGRVGAAVASTWCNPFLLSGAEEQSLDITPIRPLEQNKRSGFEQDDW